MLIFKHRRAEKEGLCAKIIIIYSILYSALIRGQGEEDIQHTSCAICSTDKMRIVANNSIKYFQSFFIFVWMYSMTQKWSVYCICYEKNLPQTRELHTDGLV